MVIHHYGNSQLVMGMSLLNFVRRQSDFQCKWTKTYEIILILIDSSGIFQFKLS
jgi:hypothetical protein